MNTRGGKRRRSIYSASSMKDENEVIDVEGYTLETLPPEVFEMILRLLPFRDVAGSIRLVSRRCSTIAMTVLNGAFIGAGIRLETTINSIKGRIPAKNGNKDEVGSYSNLLAWSKLLYVLELIKSQYKMLKAVTWRYTHPPKWAKFNRVCFYAGSLLDELSGILDVARLGPEILLSTAGASPNDQLTSPPPRVLSFLTLCKRFMNYFEKVSECRALDRSSMISGCKAVDILDCLAEGRQVTSFRISRKRLSSLKIIKGGGGIVRNDTSTRYDSRIVTMRLRYVMPRAWFTCLQVPHAPDENSWREDQSFMYLRLRRLVGSVNEHYFEKAHFERDLVALRRPHIYGRSVMSRRIFPQHPPTRRPPPASTYSGYGVYAGRFFYYGNMNKYAYESKFKDANDRTINVDSSDESGHDDAADSDEREIEEDDSEAEAEEEQAGVANDDHDNESERANDDISSSFRTNSPAFDLVIRVELRCSSDLAPLAVISGLNTSDLDEHPISHGNPELYLKLNITCPASSANRLPANFIWEQREPAVTHSRSKRPRFSK